MNLTKKDVLQSLLACVFLCGALNPTPASDAAVGVLGSGDRFLPKPTGPRPVLMVIADRLDFHYREYADTRTSIEAAGHSVRVAATTTSRSIPHPNTGQPEGTDGGVVPDIALSKVNPDNYSAIVFVGGWGASMYQYAFSDPNLDRTTDNYYWYGPYNGDDNLSDRKIGPVKVVVNNLIKEFVADGKPVGAICHGVTVLGWARVDGVSPLNGKRVVVPYIGSPAAFYNKKWCSDYELGQSEQVATNGGIIVNPVSGQLGDAGTAADDVIVDGRIITSENYDSALLFGQVVAQQVIAASSPTAGR